MLGRREQHLSSLCYASKPRSTRRSDAAARGNPDERTATGRRAVVSGLNTPHPRRCGRPRSPTWWRA